jgi:hypothetical protein
MQLHLVHKKRGTRSKPSSGLQEQLLLSHMVKIMLKLLLYQRDNAVGIHTSLLPNSQYKHCPLLYGSHWHALGTYAWLTPLNMFKEPDDNGPRCSTHAKQHACIGHINQLICTVVGCPANDVACVATERTKVLNSAVQVTAYN